MTAKHSLTQREKREIDRQLVRSWRVHFQQAIHPRLLAKQARSTSPSEQGGMLQHLRLNGGRQSYEYELSQVSFVRRC